MNLSLIAKIREDLRASGFDPSPFDADDLAGATIAANPDIPVHVLLARVARHGLSVPEREDVARHLRDLCHV